MTTEQQSPSPAASNVSPLRRIRSALSQTKLRVPVVWLRHRGFRDADVFLASYPRSGSTWLRFTVYELLTGQPSDFLSVNSSLRTIGEHFRAPGILPGGGRLIGTHEMYRPVYHRAIYIVRDVRDVALSQYLRERQKGIAAATFNEYLIGLMTGHKRHGSWRNHVLSWLDSGLGPDNLLVLTYEAMRRDPERVFSDVMRFLGAPRDAAAVRQAVANNSVDRMRAKEDHLHATAASKIPRHPVRGFHEDGRFIRKGTVGGWREKLTEQQQRIVDMYAGEALLRLGYPLTAEAAHDRATG